MRLILKMIDNISEFSGKIFSYLVWIGAFMLCWEVISRYVFNAPTIWAHGYSQRIFGIYFIMIGAFTLLRNGHVRVDLLTSRFRFRTRKLFDLMNYAILILWGAVLTSEGWEFFLNSWVVREKDEMALAHPMYPVKLLLIIGAALITLQGIAFFARSLASMIQGEEYDS